MRKIIAFSVLAALTACTTTDDPTAVDLQHYACKVERDIPGGTVSGERLIPLGGPEARFPGAGTLGMITFLSDDKRMDIIAPIDADGDFAPFGRIRLPADVPSRSAYLARGHLVLPGRGVVAEGMGDSMVSGESIVFDRDVLAPYLKANGSNGSGAEMLLTTREGETVARAPAPLDLARRADAAVERVRSELMAFDATYATDCALEIMDIIVPT